MCTTWTPDAKALARRDGDTAAEPLARAAVERALATNGFDILGEGWLDLAETLRSLGDQAAAADAAREAVRLRVEGATAYVVLAQALAAVQA